MKRICEMGGKAIVREVSDDTDGKIQLEQSVLAQRELRTAEIVETVLFHQDAKRLAEISRDLGEPMVGISTGSLRPEELLAGRGW